MPHARLKSLAWFGADRFNFPSKEPTWDGGVGGKSGRKAAQCGAKILTFSDEHKSRRGGSLVR